MPATTAESRVHSPDNPEVGLQFPRAFGCATTLEPIGYVVAFLDFLAEFCQIEYPQSTDEAMQIVRDKVDMGAPWLIVVAADDHISATQDFVEFRPPFPRPIGLQVAGTRCRRNVSTSFSPSTTKMT